MCGKILALEKKDETNWLMSYGSLKEFQQNKQVLERNEIQWSENWRQERCYRNHHGEKNRIMGKSLYSDLSLEFNGSSEIQIY